MLDLKDEWISLDIDPGDDSDDESGSDVSSYSDEIFDYENDPILKEESINIFLDENENALKLSKELHKTGHIILVQDRDRIRKSWLIINKDILLHEVHGTLFAPPHFQQHYENLCTSTGVVASSTMASMFPQYDVTMLIGFLIHLEFCQELKIRIFFIFCHLIQMTPGMMNIFIFLVLLKLKNLRACGKYLVNNPINVAGCFRLLMHTPSSLPDLFKSCF